MIARYYIRIYEYCKEKIRKSEEYMEETEKNIIKRITEVRINFAGDRGRNKFAKLIGLSPSTYSYYEKDRVPPVPVLVKISEIANVDLNWLLTGKNGQNSSPVKPGTYKILDQVQKVIEANPQSVNAISAFLNLLEEKGNFESQVNSNQKLRTSDGWIPVLGRTAAGVPAFWNQTIGTDSKIIETQLEQLVQKHLNASIVSSVSADISVDSQIRTVIKALNNCQANLIQTAGTGDEIVQFIECPDVHKLFPDSFALQVDGDSMSPRINDGDIVIITPSVPGVEGLPAVIRISQAIGVTCKLVRNDVKAVHLIPINEKYETKIANKDDILWSLAVICHIKLKSR
jgi:SOS-response transcriptional repressor LexA/DNA-binding XRE family transcriptional regulator